MFRPVTTKVDFPQMEENVLSFWQTEDIFKKSIETRSEENEYVFYDGPPFATGLPHFGHLVPGTIKDAIPRYQTMKGKRVRRGFGWDCHGLPIEALAQEALGIDGTQAIRSHHISFLSSRIAVHPQVREALLSLQRSFREKSPLVAEGRDTGSVVFPDADAKIYIDASTEERARRRHEELAEKGSDISYEKVLEDLKERDQRDASRDIAPLVVPEHAVVVDTTHLKIDEVISQVMEVIQEKLAD